MIELLKWCDVKISFLKRNGVSFLNGVPIIPREMIYQGIQYYIENYTHRNDIQSKLNKYSLVAYFDNDKTLINRIFKVDDEIDVLRQYAGICGFDLSPCVTMLRPRQRFSLLVSFIFNCFVALNGVKILPNVRVGDLSTLFIHDGVEEGTNIITGEVGCRNHGFKTYGLYQLKIIIERIRPHILFVFGNLSNKDIRYISGGNNQDIVMYPSRRRRILDGKKAVLVRYDGKFFTKSLLDEYYELKE